MRHVQPGKSISIVAILVIILAAGTVRAEWTAYNDCLKESGDSTAANVTAWTIHNNDSAHFTGRLKDFETGSDAEAHTLYVGVFGGGSVRQAGGTATFTSALCLGDQPGSSGVYDLLAGSLSAPRVYVGGSYSGGEGGDGTLNVNGGSLME